MKGGENDERFSNEALLRTSTEAWRPRQSRPEAAAFSPLAR